MEETVQEDTMQETSVQDGLAGTEGGQDKSMPESSEADTGAKNSAADAGQESSGETGEESRLYGEIQEISDQTFVLNEAIEEAGESGTDIMMLPLDEEEMKLITVAWDENTRFVQRTIRNGGADYEDGESSSEALKTGAMTEVWGSYEGEVFRASLVRLTEMV